MHLVVFVFDGDGAVIIGVPKAGRGEVKAGIAFLENSTITDKLEPSLLSVESLDDLVGNSVCPSLSFFLVVGFSV